MKHKKYILYTLILMFTGCDCVFQFSGVILDQDTLLPIQEVAIGKTDSTNVDNPFNYKILTDKKGRYEVNRIASICNEMTVYFTKKGYQTKKLTIENGSTDTVFLQRLSYPNFDLNRSFEIISFQKSIDSYSSAKDTSVCTEWILNKEELAKIIKESQPIDNTQLHYQFGHFPCQINGTIIQNSTQFDFSLNSGAWFRIYSPDTTFLYGSFKKENNKYFHDGVWTEENN